MKSYKKFLEEVEIKGNAGIPGEKDKSEPSYLRDVERQGGQEIAGSVPPQLFRQIMQLSQRANSLSSGKEKELEEFAEKMIKNIYSGVLDNVDLDIKLVRSGGEISNFMKEEDKKKEEKKEKNDKKEKEKKEDKKEESSAKPKEKESINPNIKSEIDKRKISNSIMQGEAKNTKLIIEMPECKEGLIEILGNRNGEDLHRTLIELSKVANKLDWIIPVDDKAEMMENQPEGMAGAVSVDYEEPEEGEEGEEDSTQKSAEDIIKEIEQGKDLKDLSDEIGEVFNNINPKISVRAIDFVMLLHETVKGIYELISRIGLPKDEKIAKEVIKQTSSFRDEAEDFKYGPYIARDLTAFINLNPLAHKYPNIKEHVFGKLMEMPAEQFLDTMKNILLKSPKGTKMVDDIIKDIISKLDEYQKELSDYDAKMALGETEHDENDGEDEENHETEEAPEWWKEGESDLDKLKNNKEDKKDISQLSQREIQNLIDDALDAKNYDEVRRLSQYLKEGKEIYLRELKRINENQTKRNK